MDNQRLRELEVVIPDGGPPLAASLLDGAEKMEFDEWRAGPNGTQIKVSMVGRRSLDQGTVLTLVLAVPTGVASSVIAAWLWEKLRRGEGRRIRINRTEIEVSEGEIRRVVTESLEVTDDSSPKKP